MNILSNNSFLNVYNNRFNQPQVSFAGRTSIPKGKIEELLAKGISCNEIAKRYGKSGNSIRYLLDLYGLKTKTRKTTEILNEKMPIYLKLQYGLRKIVKETELPPDRINRWIERNIKEKAQAVFNKAKTELLLSKLSNAEVAEKLGINVQQVKRLRQKNKCVVKDYAKTERFGKVLNYWKSGMSKEDIAERFNISIATINRYIREYKKDS